MGSISKEQFAWMRHAARSYRRELFSTLWPRPWWLRVHRVLDVGILLVLGFLVTKYAMSHDWVALALLVGSIVIGIVLRLLINWWQFRTH